MVGLALSAVTTLLGLGLVVWAAWLGRARGGAWRWLFLLPIGGMTVILAGGVGATAYLAWAFDAVATADPSQKAVLLADHIARAMFAGVFSLGMGGATMLVACVACAVGTVTRPPAGYPPG